MFKNIILFLGKFILFSAILFILWLPFYSAYLSLVYDFAEIVFGFTYYAKFAVSISVSDAPESSEILTPIVPFIAMVLAANKLRLSRLLSAAAFLSLILSLAAVYLNLSYIWWLLAFLSLSALVYGAGVNKNNYLVFIVFGCVIIFVFQVLMTAVYIQSVTLGSLLPAMESQGYDVSKVYSDYKNSSALMGIARPFEVILPFILGVAFIFMYSDILPRLKNAKNQGARGEGDKTRSYIKFMKDLK